MACLSICWERLYGTQKEDDFGPLGVQSSLGLSLEINEKNVFEFRFNLPNESQKVPCVIKQQLFYVVFKITNTPIKNQIVHYYVFSLDLSI